MRHGYCEPHQLYEGRNARPIDFGEGTKQSLHGGFATRFKPL